MANEPTAANIDRSYSLAATSIAIFTFVLFFLFPRFKAGEIPAVLFQLALIVMGLTTFSFVFASLHYYGAIQGGRLNDAERARYARRGDRFWLAGYTLLFLAPVLILFAVGLVAVGVVWSVLWLLYLVFVIRYFPRVAIAPSGSPPGP